ncbi:putative quinol monooxygenase [Rhizobium leguminosarum]|uniref:putative quinol monooxygenase n=1 Tax=Rhizobium leguminosarum TaxID=384 RepID=UPI0014419374|nr:antibiotic biosynthesis monooxygenase [Rhizobium leguminosarum]NKN03057.1 hypothetical protein [Rhizobium leguminosarum bv. viciae]
MSTIQATARLKIHPGKSDEFKRLSEICMRLVREKDLGTLRFEIFFNDDETEAVVLEEYANEEAFLQHTENMGENIAATLAICGRRSGCSLTAATTQSGTGSTSPEPRPLPV